MSDMREIKIAESDNDFNDLYNLAKAEVSEIITLDARIEKIESIFTNLSGMPEERAYTEMQLRQILNLIKIKPEK